MLNVYIFNSENVHNSPVQQLGESKQPLVPKDFTADPAELEDKHPLHHIEIFVRRIKLLAFTFIFCLLLGSAYVLTRPKVYEAEAKIKIATKPPASESSSSLLGALSALTASTDVNTEAEILNSPGLLKSALKSFTPFELSSGFGIQDFDTWQPTGIAEVSVVKDTSIIAVKTKSFSPELAQRYTNQVTKAYLARSLEQNIQATKLGRIFVAKKIKSLEGQLDNATAALASFQRSTGLVAPEAQVQAESEQLVNLRLASEQANQDLQAASTRIKILSSQLKKSGSEVVSGKTISENPEFSQIKTHLADLRDQLVAASSEYTPVSTVVQKLRQQISLEEAHLGSISKTIVSSVQNERNPDLDPLLMTYAGAVADEAIASGKAKGADNQVKNHESRISTFPAQARKFGELNRRTEELTRTLGILTDKWYELLITEQSGIPSAQVAESASLPTSPEYPKTRQMLIAALLAALLVAICVTFTAEKLDNTIHNPSEVGRITAMPTLAAIPKLSSGLEGGNPVLLIGESAGEHAFLEAFRLLRSGIQFSTPDKPLHILALTSSTAGEGKTTVAANLAIVTAMDGKRVLIIDCDLRRPNVHRAFNLDRNIGLTNVVAGQSSLAEVIMETSFPGVCAMTSGPLPPNPTEFLNSARARSVIAEASVGFDLVILDSPPAMGISDIQVLSTIADGVAMIVALETVSKHQLIASLDLLRRVNSNLIGTVLNKLERRSGVYGYLNYYYYNYYTNYDDQNKPAVRK